MTTVESVFNAAMGLMDELDASGEARSADTMEYELRAPSILNALTAELRTLTGEDGDCCPPRAWRTACRWTPTTASPPCPTALPPTSS